MAFGIGSAILSALGGAVFDRFTKRQSLRDKRKATAGSIRDRLKIGEEYGIHPLSMLGTSGNSFGTGGTQGLDILGDYRAQKRADDMRKHSEAREDRHRKEDRTHDKTLLRMQLAAKDKQASDAQSNFKFTPPEMRQVGEEYVMPWIQPLINLYDNTLGEIDFLDDKGLINKELFQQLPEKPPLNQ